MILPYVLRVFKCVSPAFAELDTLARFAPHVYIYAFSVSFCFPALFLSFMHSPWFDFHLWGLRCCRFCTSHIRLFYTLVNQVGSGKELLDKANDV